MDIDFAAIALSAVRVLLVGLAFGAGLPMIFSLGMRLQAIGNGDMKGTPKPTDPDAPRRRNPLALAMGWVLYAVVIAGVITGVLFVTRHSLQHYFGITVFGG